MRNSKLGVQIEKSVSGHEQVKDIKTILFKLSLLKKIKEYVPLSTRKLFYNFYIKPQFEYCNTLWNNCTESDIDGISKLQMFVHIISAAHCHPERIVNSSL